MDRGFRAVVEKLDGLEDTPPGKLLTTAGSTLVSKVGGASGPLWGTALRRAGRSLGDAEEFDGDALVEALAAALAGVQELGQAQPGDKTMVDSLTPAIEELRNARAAGASLDDALGRARRRGEGRRRGDDSAGGPQGAGVVPRGAIGRPPGSRGDVDGADRGGAAAGGRRGVT